MLSARRQSDGEVVSAYFERKGNGPFVCLQCGDPVLLKTSRSRVNHFAHVDPLSRHRDRGESDAHCRCKMELFESLKEEPGVEHLALERSFCEIRPDVYFEYRGVKVGIEVQISEMGMEEIVDRTIWYHRKGIYVLWLLQWTPALDRERYSPRLFEKWIHAAYFGHVYYWTSGLNILPYHFEPVLKSTRAQSWYSKDGEVMRSRGYTRRLKRCRRAVPGEPLHLLRDFGPKERFWWEGGGIRVPDGGCGCRFNRASDVVSQEVPFRPSAPPP